MNNQLDQGTKFDKEKLRLDLIPDTTTTGLGRVLTFGATKYEDRNWEKGIMWSRIIGALKRHLTAIERREDIDPESGLLHSEHILANAAFLNHFFHTYPEGDDRPMVSIKHRRLGLDIDGVIANFLGRLNKEFPGVDVYNWAQSSTIEANIGNLPDEFWLGLDPLVDPHKLPVEPVCYITKRESCKPEIVEEWIRRNGFPQVPVYFANNKKAKWEIAKEADIDVFVDDNYNNYMSLNDHGVLCFLMDNKYNRKFDVGYKRIYSLEELTSRFRLF